MAVHVYLRWAKHCLKPMSVPPSPWRRYDNGDAVVGHQYLGLLETHTPDIQFDEENEEHYFLYTDAGSLVVWSVRSHARSHQRPVPCAQLGRLVPCTTHRCISCRGDWSWRKARAWE